LQGFTIAFITTDVTLDLSRPVIAVRRWHPRPLAAMPVPEAAVDEDCKFETREDEVGLTWQVWVMQSKAKSRPMN